MRSRTLLSVSLLLVGGSSTVGWSHEELFRVDGAAALQKLGTEVRSAGDVDGDGVTDVLVVSAATVGSGAGAVVQVRSGADGSIVLSLDPVAPNSLGSPCIAAAGIGDVDGDDHDDLVVGLSNAEQARGLVRLVSGATGETLHEILGSEPWDHLGAEVSGAGDADGDGVPDYAYSEPRSESDVLPPRVVVRSGADHSILHEREVGSPVFTVRVELAQVGDVDMDGRGDLLIGFSRPHVIGPSGALVVSGADGSIQWEFEDAAIPSFGAWIGAPGDLDSDGHADVGVAAPFGSSGEPSVVRFYSGATGTMLFERIDPSGLGFGASIDAAGDVTQDGVNDVVIGTPHVSGVAGYLHGSTGIFSSELALPHSKVAGAYAFGMFGWAVAGLGDVDEDGIPDFAVGEPGASGGQGAMHVYSGVPSDDDGPSIFVPGDVIVGSVDPPDDDDRVRFTGLAGTKVTFEITAAASLAARIEIIGAEPEPVASWELPATEKTKKRVLKVPADGVYEVVVTGRDGSTGGYELHTALKLKKKAQWIDKSIGFTPGEPAQVTFHAGPGMSLTGFVDGKKGFTDAPALSLQGPKGEWTDLASFSYAYETTASLALAPLTDIGEFVLRADGATGVKAKVVFTLQVLPNLAQNWVWID